MPEGLVPEGSVSSKPKKMVALGLKRGYSFPTEVTVAKRSISGAKSNLRKDPNLYSDLGPDFQVWKLN